MDLDRDTVDRLLTTTRAVRKRLDVTRPVSDDVVVECLRIATQAPNAGNTQNWGWVVVTDADKRARLADIYRKGSEASYKARVSSLQGEQRRIMESGIQLMDRLHEVPVHVVPCVLERQVAGQSVPPAALYGSIFPAVWSFQLALRSRGLGSTPLYLSQEADAAEALDLPQHARIAGLLPVAYYTGGSFKLASRRPVNEVIHWNGWDPTLPAPV